MSMRPRSVLASSVVLASSFLLAACGDAAVDLQAPTRAENVESSAVALRRTPPRGGGQNEGEAFISCREPVDHGAEVRLFGNRATGAITKAVYTETTIATTNTVATMNVCNAVEQEALPGADRLALAYKCNDVTWIDGHEVELYQGGFTGLPQVRLYSVNANGQGGRALLHNLMCRTIEEDTTSRYTLPEHVIAELVSAGGFHPREYPNATGVRVFDDGRVESFEIYLDGRETSHALATLTRDRVAAVRRDAADLLPSELVQADPDAPMCADAPGITYLAKNGRGQAVALKGRFNCNEYVRQDGAYSALPDVLDGLWRLGSL